MKQNFLLGLLVIAGLTSCKETGPLPSIDSLLAADTTYLLTSVPAAQTRAFLIEDFSGIKCTNCPAAHDYITASEALYPGRIIPVTMHVFATGFVASEPHLDITPVVDFRTQDGTAVFSGIYHTPGSLPTIGISRTLENGNIQIQNRVSHLQSLINTTTPVNVSVTSAYNAANATSLIKVTAIYTGAVTKKQAVTIMLVEDSLLGPQDGVDPSSGNSTTINPYMHMQILRAIYTSASGSLILDSMATKTAGRVFERSTGIALNNSWNPDHCKIIAFISDNEPGDDKEVLQVAEVKLKP